MEKEKDRLMKMLCNRILRFSVLLTTLLAHQIVMAAATTGLPYENPLTTFRTSLSGPVALSIAIIAIVVCGWRLIWGGELGDFAKAMIMIILVVAIVVAANATLTILFGATSAVVA